MVQGVFQMKNLIKLFWLIALAAVIGLSMTACPADAGGSSTPGGGGGTGDWKDITSLSQLNGTWKCSDYWEEFNYIRGTGEMTLTITATNATTGTGSASTKVTYSGITTEQWNEMKEYMVSDDIRTYTFNDSTHTVTTRPGSPRPVELSMLNDFQINQNGTKLKIVGENGVLIFTKQ